MAGGGKVGATATDLVTTTTDLVTIVPFTMDSGSKIILASGENHF